MSSRTQTGHQALSFSNSKQITAMYRRVPDQTHSPGAGSTTTIIYNDRGADSAPS